MFLDLVTLIIHRFGTILCPKGLGLLGVQVDSAILGVVAVVENLVLAWILFAFVIAVLCLLLGSDDFADAALQEMHALRESGLILVCVGNLLAIFLLCLIISVDNQIFIPLVIFFLVTRSKSETLSIFWPVIGVIASLSIRISKESTESLLNLLFNICLLGQVAELAADNGERNGEDYEG